MNLDKRRCMTAAIGCLLLSGCSQYADFTLPPAPGGDETLRFRFLARAGPVIGRGEFQDALNPSVTGRRNLYSVFDGRTWHTALATTEDGIHWSAPQIVISPDPHTWEGGYIAANGSALEVQGRIWYWYDSGPKERKRIGLARETAGGWRKDPGPVLGYGPPGAWDEIAVADAYVIAIQPYYYMYYLGQDRASRQRIGVARSRDGVVWEKLRSNPVLEMGDDDRGLGEPAVWRSHGFYWMLYTVRDFAEGRHLELARSTDGVRWKKLGVKYTDSAAWDSKVICDPTVAVDGEQIMIWFGGGDVASPDENLHGQIGFATLVK
jgi:sucrose-6-phosphate hydrolase SacC (GH32 family)